MTLDELLKSAGVTGDQLVAYIRQLAILGTVASKQAEIAKALDSRQAVIDAQDAALAQLQQELAALEAQRDQILAG